MENPYLCPTKNLPIGIQSFSELVKGGYIYVDKTELVHKLIHNGKFYFLSRPRRFGKSLLLNTLKSLFEGQQALFSGLWIENQWDWSKRNPVLHFSFDAMSYEQLGLQDAILQELKSLAESHDLVLEATDYKSQFRELIQQLHNRYGKVVLLIDEYDKPIIDYLEKHTIEQAKVNREILRNFYSVIKSADEHLQLVFITGISKMAGGLDHEIPAAFVDLLLLVFVQFDEETCLNVLKKHVLDRCCV